MLLVQDEIPNEEAPKIPSFDEQPEDEVEEVTELSINSMVGLSALKTMKIKGKIAHQEVITMIDCKATQFHFDKIGLEIRLAIRSHNGLWGVDGHRLSGERRGHMPQGSTYSPKY